MHPSKVCVLHSSLKKVKFVVPTVHVITVYSGPEAIYSIAETFIYTTVMYSVYNFLFFLVSLDTIVHTLHGQSNKMVIGHYTITHHTEEPLT